jgi:hypothetical protein
LTDGPDAAQAALNAGTDSEMVSTNIRDFGKQLLAQGRISMVMEQGRGPSCAGQRRSLSAVIGRSRTRMPVA